MLLVFPTATSALCAPPIHVKGAKNMCAYKYNVRIQHVEHHSFSSAPVPLSALCTSASLVLIIHPPSCQFGEIPTFSVPTLL